LAVYIYIYIYFIYIWLCTYICVYRLRRIRKQEKELAILRRIPVADYITMEKLKQDNNAKMIQRMYQKHLLKTNRGVYIYVYKFNLYICMYICINMGVYLFICLYVYIDTYVYTFIWKLTEVWKLIIWKIVIFIDVMMLHLCTYAILF
jgi:hypothetical protein